MAKRKRKFVQTGEAKQKDTGASTMKAKGKSEVAMAKLRGLNDLPSNPFDLRVNRKKHEVIGKKVKGEM
ncbi:hypothetical protein SARC_17459, partial [Sphaeroforma arctica JP610]